MSFKATAWAWETPTRWPTKPVLLALANRMNEKTGQCNPSLAQLAADLGQARTSVRAVRRAITELQDLGYLEVRANFAGKGQQTSNSYVLNLGFVHEATAEGGRTESPRGAECPPPSDNTPGRQARAVSPPRAHSPGVGTHSPTNQEINHHFSRTTEEVTRTRENEDLDDLEAQMVEEQLIDPNPDGVDPNFDWFEHLGRSA